MAPATPHIIVGKTPLQSVHIPATLSMWGNDVYGDCVTAEEAFAKAYHNPEIFISVSEVEAWAKKYGFLNGATLIDVLDKMRTNGFVQGGNTYDDGVVNSVDWTNEAILKNALSQRPVKLGVAGDQLENVVPDPPSNGWFATGFTQDSNEDHCVSLCGYGTFGFLAGKLGVKVPASLNSSTFGYAMFTWSSVGIIDQPSLLAITSEAWIRTPTTVVK